MHHLIKGFHSVPRSEFYELQDLTRVLELDVFTVVEMFLGVRITGYCIYTADTQCVAVVLFITVNNFSIF